MKSKIGENNPMWGKHHTDESKKKMSEARSGIPLSDKHRQRLRESKLGKASWNKNKKLSEEHKKHLRENHANVSGERNPMFGKIGEKNPNFGRHCSDETKRKIGEAISGEKHYHWAGDDVGYKGLHLWIRKHKPKKEYCEKCGEKKQLDVANISGEYKRDINDYQWLCRRCHLIDDKVIERMINNLKMWKNEHFTKE